MTGQDDRLATTVRRLRERAQLSLRQLEEASGVHRALISRIEAGERRPKPATLHRLAEALGVDAGELLEAAGHTTNRADALPTLQPYLRAKYGHLPAPARKELADYLQRLEAEYGNTPAGTKTRKKERRSP